MQNYQFKAKADAIRQYKSSAIKYYHHERYVAKTLSFASVGELDEFITQLKRGGVGPRKGRTGWVSNPEPYNTNINVASSGGDNKLHFHMEKTGRRLEKNERVLITDEPSVAVTKQEEVYYIFKKYHDSNKDEFVPLKKQIDIIRDVIGITENSKVK